MIDLFYWPTPNGWKASIMLEECGLDYKMIPINIAKGDQLSPEFLKISPNNRMPAIIDNEADNGPVSIFESGAILYYLAEKTGLFLPTSKLKKKEVMEWVFWQTGNQGPAAGQLSHFRNFTEHHHEYSVQRYTNEYRRCLGVLERRLEHREFIVDEYSIADIINWPWVLYSKSLGENLEQFPNVLSWRTKIKERPAVRKGVDLGKNLRRTTPHTAEEREILFSQTENIAVS